MLNFVPREKIEKKLGDKIPVLSAPYTSSVGPLWNKIFSPSIELRKYLFLSSWSSYGKEREREMKEAHSSILGSIHRVGHTLRLSQLSLVKTLIQESPYLTAQVHFSSASLSCLRNVRDGITVNGKMVPEGLCIGLHPKQLRVTVN